jgi:hypothetical protein
MKINPQSFFNFCANHAPLLRALAERGGENPVRPDDTRSRVGGFGKNSDRCFHPDWPGRCVWFARAKKFFRQNVFPAKLTVDESKMAGLHRVAVRPLPARIR